MACAAVVFAATRVARQLAAWLEIIGGGDRRGNFLEVFSKIRVLFATTRNLSLPPHVSIFLSIYLSFSPFLSLSPSLPFSFSLSLSLSLFYIYLRPHDKAPCPSSRHLGKCRVAMGGVELKKAKQQVWSDSKKQSHTVVSTYEVRPGTDKATKCILGATARK